MCKSILEKWNRERYHIKTSYDSKGDFEKGYKKFQRSLDQERNARLAELRGSDDEDQEPDKKRKKTAQEHGSLSNFKAS